jgi:hypothetical protein
MNPRCSSKCCTYPLWIFILLGAFLMLPADGFAQVNITLRFLDAESGKPIKGISVGVSAWDNNEGKQKPELPAAPQKIIPFPQKFSENAIM